jgi:hypothetical protein
MVEGHQSLDTLGVRGTISASRGAALLVMMVGPLAFS